MGKQKYPIATGGVTTDGQPNKRDHTKTGKKAKRQELKRLQAIERQVRRIQTLEKALEKVEDKSAANKGIIEAKLTLQKLRGGVPHIELTKLFKPQ